MHSCLFTISGQEIPKRVLEWMTENYIETELLHEVRPELYPAENQAYTKIYEHNSFGTARLITVLQTEARGELKYFL